MPCHKLSFCQQDSMWLWLDDLQKQLDAARAADAPASKRPSSSAAGRGPSKRARKAAADTEQVPAKRPKNCGYGYPNTRF